MNQGNRKFLKELYDQYNSVLKPIFAELEARSQQYEIQIVNEVRSFFDHIARCYRPNIDDLFIHGQLKKAESHMHRALYDTSKLLIVEYTKYLEKFEKKTKNCDLSIITNGTFYPDFKALYDKAFDLLIKAKQHEAYDFEESFNYFQNAKNAFIELENFLIKNASSIKWAIGKAELGKFLSFFKWIIGIFFTIVITQFITCYFFNKTLSNIFMSLFFKILSICISKS